MTLAIDVAIEGYGFAMGPFAVADLSGLDIAHAMRRRRDETRDPGERYVAIADRLVERQRLGRKTGAGWYAYDGDGKKASDPVTALAVGDTIEVLEIAGSSAWGVAQPHGLVGYVEIDALDLPDGKAVAA